MFKEPGLKVRLRSDPTRMGITTGSTKNAGPFFLIQVEFGPNERPFKKAEQLELVPEQSETEKELLLARKWGGPDALRRALAIEKVRGQLTDVFYSMEASRTDFYPHQFKPVMKFVESPSGRILIADEVGLGKTIEAIYLWKEIEARERARRLLIVCPSMLRDKWQSDLDRLFNIEAAICSARDLEYQLNRAREKPGSTSFALIASYEAARPPKNYREEHVRGPRAEISRLLSQVSEYEEEKLLDLVVIDEAHYMRNASTLTHQLGRLLGDASRHLALLSATPIQIGSENLFNLLRLLDPDVFEDVHQFEQMLDANAPIIRAQRYLWELPPKLPEAILAIEAATRTAYFASDPTLRAISSELEDIDILTTSRRVEIGRMLEGRSLIGPYMTRSRKREVIEKRVERSPQVLSIKFNDQERQVYERVTQALRSKGEGLSGVSVFALIARQRQMASSLPAALTAWNDNGVLDDLAWEDFGGNLEEHIEVVSDVDVGPINPEMLLELERNDSKYLKLRDEFLRPAIINEPDEKIIIFAFFRGTLTYLQRRLEADGFETELIMGGSGRSRGDRTAAIERFKDPNGPSILLSSEVGSEGIDLQFCRVLVNYDLPWNPMRVEQRIGRIDRLGQKSERISIVNIAVNDTVEDRILMRLYDRIEVFRETIGDLEEILGDMSESLLQELFDPNLNDAEREQIAAQSILALENKRLQQEDLESQAANLIGFSDFLMDSIQEAHDVGRWLTPEEMIALVDDFFRVEFPGVLVQPQKEEPTALDITLTVDAARSLADFTRRTGSPRRSRLETAGNSVRCIFDVRSRNQSSKHAESIDPSHPLIRWIAEQIAFDEHRISAPVALELDGPVSDLEPGLYGFASEKWEFRGVRSEIKMAHRAVRVDSDMSIDPLDAERLVNAASRRGKIIPFGRLCDDRLLGAVGAVEKAKSILNGSFDSYTNDFDLENQHRAGQQRTSAERLASRKIGDLERRRADMLTDGKDRGAALADLQIAKQRALLKTKLDRIARLSDLDLQTSDIVGGVILLKGEN